MEHSLLPLYVNKALYNLLIHGASQPPQQTCFVISFLLLKRERKRVAKWLSSHSNGLKGLWRTKWTFFTLPVSSCRDANADHLDWALFLLILEGWLRATFTAQTNLLWTSELFWLDVTMISGIWTVSFYLIQTGLLKDRNVASFLFKVTGTQPLPV